MNRFEIINPHRWFTHWTVIVGLAIFLPSWNLLVWLDSVEDHTKDAAIGYWGFLILFDLALTLSWAAAGRKFRNADQNCVEVMPGELRFAWAGRRKSISRTKR